MALLCGQLISMLVGKASGSEKALDSQQLEKNAAEAEM